MSIFEFDREQHERQVRTEEFNDGVFKTLYNLVKKNLLPLSAAANEAGQSEGEFAAGMQEYFGNASGQR